MAKLNVKTTMAQRIRSRPDAVANYEGGLAFTTSPEMELYNRVASCLWMEPKFYGELGETENAILALVNLVDPEWVIKLAVYAREQLHLRTIPQVLMVFVANRVDLAGQPKPYIRQFGPRIMSRADEVKDVLACQLRMFGKPIPNSLRKALADRCQALSQYEVMKYAGGSGDVSLYDVLNMVHPVPADCATDDLFAYIVNPAELCPDRLPVLAAFSKLKKKERLDDEAIGFARRCNATWEFMVSHFGNKPEVWDTATLPYMATLRNLRNLVDAGVDLTPHIEKLRNPDGVRKSKQFPFRFFAAYKALTGFTTDYLVEPIKKPEGFVPDALIDALRDAMRISAENMPHFDGTTFIVTDSSSSMDALVSQNSVMTRAEIGFVLSALAHVNCDDAIVGVFGQEFAEVKIAKQDSVLTNVERLARTEVGHSTNAYLAVRYLRGKQIKVDRIILFSDMQCYHGSIWEMGDQSFVEEVMRYRSEINANARCVCVDLAGYGTTQVPENDPLTLLLAGWSDRVLDFVSLWEQDATCAIDAIGNIV